MNRIVPVLLALALLLAPPFAALPDDTTLLQNAWASLLCVLVLVAAATAFLAPEGGSLRSVRPRKAGNSAATAFTILLALALCSLLARLVMHHNAAYLGQMLRSWGVLATEFALFALCRSLARAGRGPLYLLTGAAILGSAIISAIGVNEYLLHFVAHQSSWRVFATSTPDFLAGYLILLLPVTLALFLSAPGEKRLPLLFGLVIVLQVATLLTTGSRFALVSLVAAFVVFGVTLAAATRRGLTVEPTTRRRLAGIAVVVVLAGLAAAGPILRRLHSTTEGNSAAFRIWTWRGAARMAAANPLLGAGVGTWLDTYPRYALTGFTRLAHNSYLQLADECGIPAVLALVVTLGGVGLAGIKGLKTPLTAASSPDGLSSDAVTAIAPTDDRLLLCGLLGSLTGGVIQNLIDSDWYVFFFAVTFWAMAGLAVGMSERIKADTTNAPVSRRRLAPIGAVGGLLAVLFATQGIAAWFGHQAQTAGDPEDAHAAYSTAQTWDPLNGRYPAELGARVLARTGDFAGAEASLRQAIRLEPSSTNFRRLGTILDAAKKSDEAILAYQDGLRIDPNSLDLLLALAKDSPPDQALTIYRRIAALEDTPVGKVRAIGEVTEARFAIADTALASAAGNTAEAAVYGVRAQKLIEAYIDEGGTLNGERQIQSSGHADPMADTQMRDIYAQVMTKLAAVSPTDQRSALATRTADYGMRFQAIIAAGQGDTAPDTSASAAAYGQAADTLEHWVTNAPALPDDAKGGAQLRDLYKRVMDTLITLAPAEQQTIMEDRERAGMEKFAARFPTP